MFSLRDRGLYLAITSIIWAIGSSIGPVLGGLFTTRLDWRWSFWINLPIGGVVFAVLFCFLDLPSPNTTTSPTSSRRGGPLAASPNTLRSFQIALDDPVALPGQINATISPESF
ncbi:Efflux pump dotC [Colletotrichum orbiculare MAFF 240422]|uniref:Efflux pump dotC n=1 Tax=Colletotrichum orbiculare (strain 104-T / ATCC 96160 / CBS 514.97 / LARS 414 / MAFF 240422) TaxID=1213857 RepID=N4W207_COLOR|nr:Efflux pump dotC [Colletotrichum orbiculare MAFF 240422]